MRQIGFLSNMCTPMHMIFCGLKLSLLGLNESARRESEFPQLCDKSSTHLVFMKNKWFSPHVSTIGRSSTLKGIVNFERTPVTR